MKSIAELLTRLNFPPLITRAAAFAARNPPRASDSGSGRNNGRRPSPSPASSKKRRTVTSKSFARLYARPPAMSLVAEIGRASCRERVEVGGGAGQLKREEGATQDARR